MASRSRSPSPYYRRRSPSSPRRARSGSSRRRSPSPRRRRSPSPPTRRDDNSRKRDRGRSNERYSRRHSPNGYSRQPRTTDIDGITIRPEESYTDFRTRVRNESTKTIWAPSPERARSMTPEDRPRKSKKSKRHDTDSATDSSSSEEDERRHRRSSRSHRSSKHKSSKSSRHKSGSSSRRTHKSSSSRHGSSRHKSSSHRHSKKKRYSSSSSSSASSSSSEDEDDKTKRSPTHEKPALEVDQSQLDQVQDLWVEKQVDLPEDLAPVGPVPLAENEDNDERAYGSQLLPGEGSAMAAYVKEGKRIPRRGEIGLSGDQIAEFEKAGYVMSGSRHQRMNAVRLRKENQVISAEEKRLVLQHAQEQKIKRENEIISGFREILSDKFKKEDE
ncbi:ras-induced vulval development antagonist-domain-containing protein [Mucor lusitanicus]|uniref:Ras-induced vulval development antagonist-domain-containing protein n=2 Tax=Mucor circinelloides f. lusitanicus TaxID=29924 RepID=A0A8H4BJ07_MUCCL|nr:ras-induced vulval development antagonist-domain-containing protein [Mucor lusitanicus]